MLFDEKLISRKVWINTVCNEGHLGNLLHNNRIVYRIASVFPPGERAVIFH